MVAKIRPCLVLSIPPNEESDRVLVTIVPHTTSPRGSRFKVSVPAHFLKAGVFDTQNLVTIPLVKLIRRLGSLSSSEFGLVTEAVSRWLGLKASP
jgi:mRNA interferase MazF